MCYLCGTSEPDDGACLSSRDPTPANTPDLGVAFCSTCQPERSVLDRRDDGKVWFEKFCATHDPRPAGDADDEARSCGLSEIQPPSGGMADGRESNAAACDIIHHREGGRDDDQA